MKLSLALVLALSAAPLASAQSVPPADATVLTQDVNNVLVDVVVTSKYGMPVKGLGKEHFKVLENGVPQTISFFEERQATPPPSQAPPSVVLPADVYTNFTSHPDVDPPMVLLLDSLNTPVADQVKSRLAMLDFLKQIPAGTHIAIFTLSDRLHLLQGFTGDPAVLIAALAKIESMPKQSHLTDDPGQDTYADSMPKLSVGAGGESDLMSAFVSHETETRMQARVTATLTAFNALSEYLSALPGRKNLVWFSGSFPLSLGTDVRVPQGITGADFQTENIDGAHSFEEALHKTDGLLQQARVAVYPMLAGGLQTQSQFASNLSNNTALHNTSRTMNQYGQESSQQLDVYATMEDMAEATGGHAFHSTNDLGAALRQVASTGANYYSLAYIPKDPTRNGKYRKLEIKVDEPKARLDYRRGYFADDPAKTGADKLSHPAANAALLLRGAPEQTQVLFKVRVAPMPAPIAAQTAVQPASASSPSGSVSGPAPGFVRYSINWIVDIRGLALPLSKEGLRHGGLELILVDYDRDGKPRSSNTNSASMILKPEEYANYLKTGLPFHQELDLPLGLNYLRVAAVTTAGGRAGSTEIPLLVRPGAAR